MNHGYNWVIHSTALTYGDSPSFVNNLDGLPGGYTSLYAVTEEAARAIKAAGTTARFAGIVWSERLWIDFDSYESGRAAEQELKEQGYDLEVYDTGGRGLHIGILRATAPSHTLPYQDKEWVRAYFPEADLSIYTHLHLFRLPRTVHERTGRQKELLSRHPGKVLTLPIWRRRDEPRANVDTGYIRSDTNSPSILESIRVMAYSVPTRVGERHPTLLKLTYALKELDVDEPYARWYVGEVNKLAEEPKSRLELDNIVRKVYESKETF